jgi:type II secretory pathway pseudopilin PulG
MGAVSEKGFSLIEVLVATLLLTTGVLSLLGVMTVAVQRAATSTDVVIAREKAREAVESVHTARDTGLLSWPTIRNVSAGGVFLDGAQPLSTPGPDGLTNTADDGDVETLRTPGADGILGNDDDVQRALTGFTREIVISDLPGNGGGINPNLREIIVRVRFQVNDLWREYVLRTYVSSFS